MADDFSDRALGLLPIIDTSPSSAIQMAIFDPTDFTVTFTFVGGETYSFPCTVGQFAAYRLAGSKGQAFHQMFK